MCVSARDQTLELQGLIRLGRLSKKSRLVPVSGDITAVLLSQETSLNQMIVQEKKNWPLGSRLKNSNNEMFLVVKLVRLYFRSLQGLGNPRRVENMSIL